MSDPARRLFFALWPDDATRHALAHWQTHNLPGDVRWQHRADLHLTLHFLGQVDAARLGELHATGAAARARRFVLVLDEIGYWPRPQVLWAGAGSLPGELPALHGALGEALRAQGFATEDRAYQPHVTLARKVRHRPPVGPLAPVSWCVEQLALVESVPGQVPAYRPLARWTLD